MLCPVNHEHQGSVLGNHPREDALPYERHRESDTVGNSEHLKIGEAQEVDLLAQCHAVRSGLKGHIRVRQLLPRCKDGDVYWIFSPPSNMHRQGLPASVVEYLDYGIGTRG